MHRTTVYRLVWTDGQGQHVGAPRFYQREKAERQRRLLLNVPAVLEARVVPLVLRPLEPLPTRPA